MNLSFPGMDLAPIVRSESDAGQWFTPADIAWRMRRWAGNAPIRFALEPSAGSGNLVHALHIRQSGNGEQEFSSTEIDAYEIDPHYAAKLRARFPHDPDFNSGGDITVHQADYLSAPRAGVPYDLGLANPPYEDGKDGAFLAKMMDDCQRIIALVRLAALVGQARTETVWKRCQPGGDFALRGLALFAGRPRFEAGRAIGDREDGGSAKADFCVVKLSRRTEAERGVDVPTSIEWWMP